MLSFCKNNKTDRSTEAGASLPTAQTTWSASNCENKQSSDSKISLKIHHLGTARKQQTDIWSWKSTVAGSMCEKG